MRQITIRNIEDSVRLKLKTRAAAKGRSLEAELREILIRAASETEPSRNIGRSIRERFKRIGGVKLELPARGHDRPVPDFGR